MGRDILARKYNEGVPVNIVITAMLFFAVRRSVPASIDQSVELLRLTAATLKPRGKIQHNSFIIIIGFIR